MVFDARKFKALDNKAYILEFSLYPYPIGRNQTNIICWEWRWDWLHYQMQANRFLLDQLKKANERNAELICKVDELQLDIRDKSEIIRDLKKEVNDRMIAEMMPRDLDPDIRRAATRGLKEERKDYESGYGHGI